MTNNEWTKFRSEWMLSLIEMEIKTLTRDEEEFGAYSIIDMFRPSKMRQRDANLKKLRLYRRKMWRIRKYCLNLRITKDL